MALIYNHLGVCGLKLWKFACVAATMVSLALALAETGASRAVQSNVLGVVAIAIMPQIQFRSQLFTFMFSAQDAVLFARAKMPMAPVGALPASRTAEVTRYFP